MYAGQTKIADDSRQKLFEAVGLLNTFLEGKSYVTGSEQPTIADLSIFASVANIVVSPMALRSFRVNSLLIAINFCVFFSPSGAWCGFK